MPRRLRKSWKRLLGITLELNLRRNNLRITRQFFIRSSCVIIRRRTNELRKTVHDHSPEFSNCEARPEWTDSGAMDPTQESRRNLTFLVLQMEVSTGEARWAEISRDRSSKDIEWDCEELDDEIFAWMWRGSSSSWCWLIDDVRKSWNGSDQGDEWKQGIMKFAKHSGDGRSRWGAVRVYSNDSFCDRNNPTRFPKSLGSWITTYCKVI